MFETQMEAKHAVSFSADARGVGGSRGLPDDRRPLSSLSARGSYALLLLYFRQSVASRVAQLLVAFDLCGTCFQRMSSAAVRSPGFSRTPGNGSRPNRSVINLRMDVVS